MFPRSPTARPTALPLAIALASTLLPVIGLAQELREVAGETPPFHFMSRAIRSRADTTSIAVLGVPWNRPPTVLRVDAQGVREEQDTDGMLSAQCGAARWNLYPEPPAPNRPHPALLLRVGDREVWRRTQQNFRLDDAALDCVGTGIVLSWSQDGVLHWVTSMGQAPGTERTLRVAAAGGSPSDGVRCMARTDDDLYVLVNPSGGASTELLRIVAGAVATRASLGVVGHAEAARDDEGVLVAWLLAGTSPTAVTMRRFRYGDLQRGPTAELRTPEGASGLEPAALFPGPNGMVVIETLVGSSWLIPRAPHPRQEHPYEIVPTTTAALHLWLPDAGRVGPGVALGYQSVAAARAERNQGAWLSGRFTIVRVVNGVENGPPHLEIGTSIRRFDALPSSRARPTPSAVPRAAGQ